MQQLERFKAIADKMNELNDMAKDTTGKYDYHIWPCAIKNGSAVYCYIAPYGNRVFCGHLNAGSDNIAFGICTALNLPIGLYYDRIIAELKDMFVGQITAYGSKNNRVGVIGRIS